MDTEIGWEKRLDDFGRLIAEKLKDSGWLGTWDSLQGYLLGLILPGERKSMEPRVALGGARAHPLLDVHHAGHDAHGRIG
jgi:hypothetical protein